MAEGSYATGGLRLSRTEQADMADALQSIVDGHTAALNAFAATIRERDADLKADAARREAPQAERDARERELLPALQALRGESRALTGRSPLQS